MYKLTYRKNKTTVRLIADEFKIKGDIYNPFYEVTYCGMKLTIPKDGMVSLELYRPYQKKHK